MCGSCTDKNVCIRLGVKLNSSVNGQIVNILGFEVHKVLLQYSILL